MVPTSKKSLRIPGVGIMCIDRPEHIGLMTTIYLLWAVTALKAKTTLRIGTSRDQRLVTRDQRLATKDAEKNEWQDTEINPFLLSLVSSLQSRKGFSLMEVLVTVIFVTLASQLIQTGFLKAADVYSRYTNTLEAIIWSNAEVGRSQEAIFTDSSTDGGGTLLVSGKEISWRRSIASLGQTDLYGVKVDVSWLVAGKPFQIEKEQYVYRQDPSKAF